METKKILFRKEMKLVALLLTSMLIATASAAVYYSLTLKPKVTTEALTPVEFVLGADSTAAGASISTDGTWASLTGLKAYPNVTLTYAKAINVSNPDGSDHDISLRHVSISPTSGWNVANFTSITFKLVNVAGTEVATFLYTVTGTGASSSWVPPSPTTPQSLPAGKEWSIKIETKAAVGATAGIAVDIDIALDVQ